MVTFLSVMLDEMAELQDRLVIGVKLQIEFSDLKGLFVLLVPNQQKKLNSVLPYLVIELLYPILCGLRACQCRQSGYAGFFEHVLL